MNKMGHFSISAYEMHALTAHVMANVLHAYRWQATLIYNVPQVVRNRVDYALHS